MTDPLDGRIRELLAEIDDVAPPPRPYSSLARRSHVQPPRRRIGRVPILAIATTAVAVVAIALMLAGRDAPERVVTVPTTAATTATVAPVPTTQPVSTPMLVGTRWVFTESSAPVVPHIEFADDGTFTGFDGCNDFSGTWALDGSEVVIADIAGEGEACAEQERPTGRATLAPDGELRFADGLTASRLDALPMAQPSDLAGRWAGFGRVVVTSDGAIAVGECTGGRWEQDFTGGRLVISGLELSAGCAGGVDPGLIDQVERFMAALASGPEVRRTEDGSLLLDGDVAVVRLTPFS